MRFGAFVALLAALCSPLAAQARGDTLTIPELVHFQEGLNVPEKVVAECDLEKRLAKYLAGEAKGPYKKVVMRPGVSPETPGHVLDIRITAMLAPGGGKYSGPKSLTTQGTLYGNGQVIGTFVARRQTRRGRHTCHMLHNDAEEIAEDIGKWLRKPTLDAKLGDAD